MKSARVTVLLLPGLGNSGPLHWQSEWERHDASMIRVMQDEWEAPRREDWATRLDAVIAVQREPVVLVTHSSSCALVAHGARAASTAQLGRVRGALLVAPSDPTGTHYPTGPTGFAPVPLQPLPFPSIVVASDDDLYVSEAMAKLYAAAWGSQFVSLPGAGHINSESRLGLWEDGLRLLDTLRK